MLRWLAQSERKLRLSVDGRILRSQDKSLAERMWLASLYLQTRFLVLQRAVRSGLWIADGLNVLMALALAPGDIFFDIGANVGWVTERAAWLVGKRGSVHSFEPSPTTSDHLRRRLMCMGLSNVVVNQFALGAAAGSATLYECAENYGGSSSLRIGAAPGQHLSAETRVAVKILDDYVDQNFISQVRMIKMDVQGSEIDVLHGARRLLTSSNRPVLFVEVEQVANAAFGYSVTDLINELAGLGYSLFSWREIGLVNVESEKDIPATGHDDVICLSPGIHDMLYNKLEWLGRRATG
jgi:FkbM family methyltransferase